MLSFHIFSKFYIIFFSENASAPLNISNPMYILHCTKPYNTCYANNNQTLTYILILIVPSAHLPLFSIFSSLYIKTNAPSYQLHIHYHFFCIKCTLQYLISNRLYYQQRPSSLTTTHSRKKNENHQYHS